MLDIRKELPESKCTFQISYKDKAVTDNYYPNYSKAIKVSFWFLFIWEVVLSMQNGHLLIMFKWPYMYNNYILKIKTWGTNSGHKSECCLGARQFIHKIFFQVHNNL